MISPEPDELGIITPDEKHGHVIIHFDIDCFYAQVEIVRNPTLVDKPVGVQQRTLVVTSNYIARERGIYKCMPVIDALNACPELVLINGEDVAPYREYAEKITSLLREYSDRVEKLGFDENFVDVTEYVSQNSDSLTAKEIQGRIFQEKNYEDIQKCECGCDQLLIKGATLAKTIRERIYKEIGLTTCAGVSWNKLVSKLLSPMHKPNNQTIMFPSQLDSLMYFISDLKKIPGIGRSTLDKLSSIGVTTIAELQLCNLTDLDRIFDRATALRLLKLSYGIDDSSVKFFEKNKSIGVEDSIKPITAFSQCKEKLKIVLKRVSKLLIEDGRVPTSLKVSIRYKNNSGDTVRDSRQTAITSALFRGNVANICLPEVEENILKKSLELTKKMTQPLKHIFITLFGISFGKLIEKKVLGNSFFFPKNFERVVGESSCSQTSRISDEDPSDVYLDETVLSELPLDLKNEVLSSYRSPKSVKCQNEFETQDCPNNWDPEVYKSLPVDIREELALTSKRPAGETLVQKQQKRQKSILEFLYFCLG
ncbi:DNA polymerase iota-like isoform X2 [Artemia franciscana]